MLESRRRRVMKERSHGNVENKRWGAKEGKRRS